MPKYGLNFINKICEVSLLIKSLVFQFCSESFCYPAKTDTKKEDDSNEEHEKAQEVITVG